MKNIELNVYGVEAMSRHEMIEENGGFWVAVGWLLIGVLVSECLDRDAQADFEEGAADARKWLGKE